MIPDPMRGKDPRLRGKPGFRWVTHRTGPLCTPAFAMTDQKSQGKQFSEVLLNLKGVLGNRTSHATQFYEFIRTALKGRDVEWLTPLPEAST